MPDSNPHTPDSFPSRQPLTEGVRRLAAIMFTDIKDFSKKMQVNEALMLRMLEIHNGMMNQTVQKYRGNVIKTIGDAFLISFESVVDAASCAVEAQQNFLDYNKDKPSDEKLMVRIGLHLGDIVVKEGDVFGDGVNIASRVQAMAAPGGVNITESVYQQVKNKLDIHVVRLGAPQLKGMKEAIRVYQVIMIPDAKRRGKLATNLYVAKTLLKRKRSKQVIGMTLLLFFILLWVWSTFVPFSSIKSIAVLPFENFGSQEQEYLLDGLSTEIISQLSRIPEILVISKASSFSFKGSILDDRSIANHLGVEYLLKGNVQSVAGQVRVEAILLEPTTGARVWTETYTLSQNELFNLQYQIPRQIAERFKLQFVAKLEQSTPEVYDLYSRGLFEERKQSRESNLAAMGYYMEALGRDSIFVPVLVAFARAHLLNYYYGWDRSEQSLASGEYNCLTALRLDSTNAEAFAILGELNIAQGNRERGVELLKQSLTNDPKNFLALTALGREYLFNLNAPATAISYLQRASETAPTNFILAGNIGIGYAILKNYPSAINAFRRAGDLNPNNDYPLRNLAIAFERTGQYDSALTYYRKAVEKNPVRPDNYLYWSDLLLAINRSVQAESVLTVGLHQLGKSYRILYGLGLASYRQGKDVEAFKMWREGLQLAKDLSHREPSSVDHLSYAALFNARLKKSTDARAFVRLALRHDSTSSEVAFNAARVYAIIGDKEKMLTMFTRARFMNPEYDGAYLATALDFEDFKQDVDLIRVAQ